MVSSHAQIIVKIGLSADSYDAEPEPLRLAWTLTNQVKTVFFPSIERKLIEKDYSYSSVVEVQEATGADFMLALAALRQAKGETSDAIAILVNKESKTKLMRQSSLEEEKKIAVAASAPSSGTADEKWLVAQYGCDVTVAKLALQLEGNMALPCSPTMCLLY
jgi:5-formyltetrahydrofolate cyclo-ligase